MKSVSHWFMAASFVIASALSNSALAATTCSGPVTTLGIGGGGIVTVSLGGLDHMYLCSTTSQECKDIYAVLLSSKISGKPVTLYFDYSGSAVSCSDRNHFPAWSYPKKTYYYMEMN